MPIPTSWSSRLLALAVGLLVSAVAGEAVLRALDLPERWLPEMAPAVPNEAGLIAADPGLLYRPTAGWCVHCRGSDKPWSTSPRRITVHASGARRIAGEEARRPGTFRILAVGGSNTWGAETSDGENWPDYLEARLNAAQPRAVEVWNFGVSGWETSQKVAALRELIPRMQPDAIILQVHNLGPRFTLEGSDPAPLVARDPTLLNDWIPGVPIPGGMARALWDHLALARLPTYIVERRRRANAPQLGLPPRTIRATHERGLSALQSWLNDDPGIPVLLLVPIPGVQDNLPGALQGFRALGVPILELVDAEESLGAEGRSIHPGPAVHDWYAARVAEVLVPAWLE